MDKHSSLSVRRVRNVEKKFYKIDTRQASTVVIRAPTAMGLASKVEMVLELFDKKNSQLKTVLGKLECLFLAGLSSLV